MECTHYSQKVFRTMRVPVPDDGIPLETILIEVWSCLARSERWIDWP